MENITGSSYYGSLKRYWRRRKYQRLMNGTTSNRKKLKIVRLGGSSSSSNKVRLYKPKLHYNLKMVSVKMLLVRFHKAYVDAMIRLATGMRDHQGVFKSKKVAKDHHQIRVVSAGDEEVDCRLVLELYKRLAASHQFAGS